MRFKKTFVLLFLYFTCNLGSFAGAEAKASLNTEDNLLAAELLDSPSFNPASCDSAVMQEWFQNCIYHRANCWEYNPGGYCYGASRAWGQCTGRRPPSLGC